MWINNHLSGYFLKKMENKRQRSVFPKREMIVLQKFYSVQHVHK